jgi:hypothetical protein
MTSTLSLSKVLKPEAGWYRGDFHTHTNFSDGYYSPAELVEVARLEGLDFVAVTDHNTIDGYAHFGNPPDLLVIPGVEITRKVGHFNVFGIAGGANWLRENLRMDGYGHQRTMTTLMQQTAARRLLNSINHPLLRPWEWQDDLTELANVHCLEIWNDPSWPDNAAANPQTVSLWSDWLNAGHRITALGGSDYHRPEPKSGENKPPERLGLPSTFVYAENLSGAAILKGVRQRRVYVTTGPRVSFQAYADGTIHEIGADLKELDGTIEFKGTVSNHDSPARIQLIKNGYVMAEAALQEGTGVLQHSDKVTPTDSAWYRLDVLDQNEQILAVTNPIFIGRRYQPSVLTYGAFRPKPSHNEVE